jgi:F-type H+-transporting ATPase subunit epsilon
MKLDIVTPQKVISEDAVTLVSLESVEGSLSILPGHVPLLAKLKVAPLFYQKTDKKEFVAVMGGFVKVNADKITIIADDAERAVEIDVLKAHKEREEAQAELTKKAEISDMIKAEVQLRRALVRIKVSEETKKI